MVKFGKNKFKILNKLNKKQNVATVTATTNKVIKKKINAEKKVSFQKEVLLKETFKSDGLVKNISATEALQKRVPKPEKQQKPAEEVKKVKLKPVEKQKKRQKTQISDTKLLLSLMKKK